MISESQALAALPDEGFVRDYVRYAMKVTDGNAAYHVAGALVLLSQVAPHDICVPFATPLYTNLFALSVGPSTDSRKSAGVSLCRGIMEDAGLHDQIGDEPGSREGLVDMLAAEPRSVIFYSEFGDFLAATRFGYLEKLRQAYTNLYDCQPLSRALAGRKQRKVQAPRMSIFGGVTVSQLEYYTIATDWEGGFMGRFFTVYAPRERDYAFQPMDDKVARANVVSRLRGLARIDDVELSVWAGPCLGLSPGAHRCYFDWYKKNAGRKASADEQSKVGLLRAPAMAAKVAVLLSLDAGAVRSKGWHIEEQEMYFATRIMEMHVESVIEVASRLAPNKDLKDRIRVLEVIRAERGPISLGEISRRSKVGLKKRVIDVVQTLEEERLIRRVQTPNGSAGDYFVAVEHDASPDAKIIQLFKDAAQAPTLEGAAEEPTATAGEPSELE